MLKYIFTSIIVGFVFGILDVVINANPYAQKLLDAYRPIAKTSINTTLGFTIDLLYGFIIAGLFLLLYKNLPSQSNLVKGLSFGLIMWFFRVVMYVLSQFIMFNIPVNTLIYMLIAGLVEMLFVGFLIGLMLKV